MIRPGEHLEYVWASYLISWGAIAVYLWYALKKVWAPKNGQGESE